jgi:arylsulfatase A-like enzyme
VTPGPRPRGERLATVALWALALTLPLGALLQPWLLPARSALPAVPLLLDAPVILITVAGLRADRLHHLGHARALTPVMDAFERSGTSFALAWANSNEERATTAALLTGRCPTEAGVREADDVLPDSVVTLGERARDHGYATGAVLANPALIGANLEQGFRHVETAPGATADAAFARALALLDGKLGQRYLLWIDLGDLQAPYGGAALDLSAFAPDAPPAFGSSAGDYGLDERAFTARGWGDQERRWLSLRYDAAVAALDASLGRFLAALDERMQLQTLMLAVTGTRGERLDERPGPVGAHGIDLYDASLRVPLLLRLPARHLIGQRTDRLAMSIDLAPTLAEIGLRKEWTDVRGTSLVPVLRNRKPVRSALYSEGRVDPEDGAPFYGYAFSSESYKLVTDSSGARARLTMRVKDPGERDPIPVATADFQSLWKKGETWWQDCAKP